MIIKREYLCCDFCNPEGCVSTYNGRGYAEGSEKDLLEIGMFEKRGKKHICCTCLDEEESLNG
jgi:hypothetical protein